MADVHSRAAQLAKAVLRPQPKVTLIPGDCLEVLRDREDHSVHMVLTDPPYFLDGLDDKWSKGKNGSRRATGAIGGLPVGMKFDRKQGYQFQEFMSPVSEQLFRVLKPGGFALVFSSPRLYHRLAVAMEDAGFEIRDQYAWRYTRSAQFKAFGMDHFIKQRKDLSEDEKHDLVRELKHRKTPQLRPQFESILCAQKPREGTFLENWEKHETGLVDVSQTLTGNAPTTVMTVEKPLRAEKMGGNHHLTVKPVRICNHLIRVFSLPGQIVLDPFLGSGTTCCAAYGAGRHSVGIDISPEYVEIAKKRVEELARGLNVVK